MADPAAESAAPSAAATEEGVVAATPAGDGSYACTCPKCGAEFPVVLEEPAPDLESAMGGAMGGEGAPMMDEEIAGNEPDGFRFAAGRR